MRHASLLTITLLCLSFALTQVYAQQAIPAAGGEASGSGGSVSYSVGQTFFSFIFGPDGSLAEGVQQPYEISMTTGTEEAKGIDLIMSVFPNPAVDFLTLKIENHPLENLSYHLYDIKGRVLQNQEVTENLTSIDMSRLLPSSYFLKVMDKKKMIKTFKIIKN